MLLCSKRNKENLVPVEPKGNEHVCQLTRRSEDKVSTFPPDHVFGVTTEFNESASQVMRANQTDGNIESPRRGSKNTFSKNEPRVLITQMALEVTGVLLAFQPFEQI